MPVLKTPSTTEDPDLSTAPLHMNATRVPEKIHSSTSPPNGSPRGRGQLRSYSLPNITLSATEGDDILTDRMGFTDLNCSDTQKIVKECLEHRRASLPSITERLSEASLDDCYAFSDLKTAAGRKHRCMSEIVIAPPALESLVESDDELEEEVDKSPATQQEKKGGFVSNVFKMISIGHSGWKDLPQA